MQSPLTTIDLAHPPMSQPEAEVELARAVAAVRNSSYLRILKVIHGYGSSGKGGSTREVVRNWTFRQRRKFRGVIEGEHYSLYDEETRLMFAEVGLTDDPDLHAPNPGITILWIR